MTIIGGRRTEAIDTQFQVVVILWLAFSGITDLVIAGSMVVTLVGILPYRAQ
jgi:hypothetical protein